MCVHRCTNTYIYTHTSILTPMCMYVPIELNAGERKNLSCSTKRIAVYSKCRKKIVTLESRQ